MAGGGHHNEKPATTDDPYARSSATIREPPVGFAATLRHLGPGMILVGSVVGSGELLMTTKLGAEAGFVLLWFVLLSCLIKVVVQAELARHTISSGRTFLDTFNSLPGPKGRRPVWLNLEWMTVVVLSSLASLAAYSLLDLRKVIEFAVDLGSLIGLARDALRVQQAAIKGVGIFVAVATVCVLWALAIRWRTGRNGTLTTSESSSVQRPVVNWVIWLWLVTVLIMFMNGGAILGAAGQAVELAVPGVFGSHGGTIWAVVVAVVAGSILVFGGYQTLERFSIGLVAAFTVLTIVCTFLLQRTGFAITPEDIREGLALHVPSPLAAGVIMTALAMYAGTGIGTGEMMSYTYWCVEKGYARNTGESEPGDAWPKRARGWIRVMYTDVFLTMIVYTASTICFYFLGAAILHELGKNPDGPQTVAVIGSIYTETLGSWAATLFVVGAFFVLFSTVVSGVAGSTRAMADGLAVLGLIDARDYPARRRFFRIFTVASLTLHAVTYSLFENPTLMLMITSIVAVLLYPVLGLGAVYLRHRDVDPRIAPGKATTCWLWVCGIALALISPVAILLALAIESGWIAI